MDARELFFGGKTHNNTPVPGPRGFGRLKVGHRECLFFILVSAPLAVTITLAGDSWISLKTELGLFFSSSLPVWQKLRTWWTHKVDSPHGHEG